MNRYLLALFAIFISTSSLAKTPNSVRVWNRNFDKSFHLEVIKMALELSRSKYGDYSIESSPPMEQGRVFTELGSGALVNVVIAGISKVREQDYHPILIPLDKGLLGFRICLVNNTRVSFEDVHTLKDFSKRDILIGVGTHWPDRQIYEANGLKVLSTPLYENLFDMLEKRRFDCLPRSVNELDVEIKAHLSQNFIAEESIALIYPSADFMFVSKAHPRLKERMAFGIKKAFDTGEFSRLFERYYSEILQKYNFYNRKLLILENPLLSIEAQKAINQYGIATFLNSSL